MSEKIKNSLNIFLIAIILVINCAHDSFAVDTNASSTTPVTAGNWSSAAPVTENFQANSPLPPATSTSFAANVMSGLTAMHVAGAKMAGKLIPVGITLLAVFYAITLVWYVYEGLASQQLDVLFKKMISHTVIAGIAMEMLLGWSDPNGGGSVYQGIGIANFLISGMGSLNDAFTTAGDPSDQVIAVFYQAIVGVLSIVDSATANFTSLHIVEATVSGGLNMLIILVILTIAVGLICAGLLTIAMVYALFYVNLGDFIIYIGLAVGPIFVATLVFPAAQGFFSKWLEFVISGGMYKLIAVIVGGLWANLFSIIGQSGADIVTLTSGTWLWQTTGAIVEFFAYSLILIFWSLFTYFITKQIPHFVTALVGGANIHLGSLKSLAPHPPGSMPSFKSAQTSASETAGIKAAASIRTAELKSATTIRTAEIKAATETYTAEISAATETRTAMIKAAGATQAAATKSSTAIKMAELKKSLPTATKPRFMKLRDKQNESDNTGMDDEAD